MFPQVGSQTVIVFKYIQFNGKWSRTFPVSGTSYQALGAAEVIVVEEVSSGNNVTYRFKLKANDEVFVTYADSQIHIPAPCIKSSPGDETRCG